MFGFRKNLKYDINNAKHDNIKYTLRINFIIEINFCIFVGCQFCIFSTSCISPLAPSQKSRYISSFSAVSKCTKLTYTSCIRGSLYCNLMTETLLCIHNQYVSCELCGLSVGVISV